jgi:hypothetical protein
MNKLNQKNLSKTMKIENRLNNCAMGKIILKYRVMKLSRPCISGLLLLLFGFQVISAYSQQTGGEEITVVAPYQPTVSDAFKINVSPRIPDEKLIKPELKYSLLSKLLVTPPELETIVPARIEGESVSKLQNNYARVGFGNYATPFIDFYANKLRSKTSSFGVRLNHISSSGRIKNYAYPGQSRSEIAAFGKQFFQNHTLSAEAYAKRRGIHFYGYKPDDFPGLDLANKEIGQAYTRLGLNTGFESNYTTGNLVNHRFGLGYYHLFDKYKTSENNLLFTTSIDKQMEFFSFSDTEKLGVDFEVDFNTNKDTLQKYNSSIERISPYYHLQFDQYRFEVGLNTSIRSDSNAKVHVYPMVKVEVTVVEEHLVTFAGISGNLDRNSLRSFSDENPFIISTIQKEFTNRKIEQFGGLKGRVTRYLDYSIGFMSSTVKNMPFFVNDTLSALGDGLNNQFTVVYDDVKYTRLFGEFGFQYKDLVRSRLKIQYNDYFLDNEDRPWHKPGLEVTLSADYNIQNKILVHAALFTNNGAYARLFEEDAEGEVIVKEEKLKGLADMNLGIEYRYSNALSGFVNFNNILGRQYFQWYNYPSYRFNMLLGVTYSF